MAPPLALRKPEFPQSSGHLFNLLAQKQKLDDEHPINPPTNIFLFGQPIDGPVIAPKSENNTQTDLMAIGKPRNGVNERFSISSRVINPRNIKHKQNSSQNASEVNPRRDFLLRQVEGGGVFANERRRVLGVSEGASGEQFNGK